MTRAALLQAQELLGDSYTVSVEETLAAIDKTIAAMMGSGDFKERAKGVELANETIRLKNRAKQLDTERLQIVTEAETTRYVGRQQAAVDQGGVGGTFDAQAASAFVERMIQGFEERGPVVVPRADVPDRHKFSIYS